MLYLPDHVMFLMHTIAGVLAALFVLLIVLAIAGKTRGSDSE